MEPKANSINEPYIIMKMIGEPETPDENLLRQFERSGGAPIEAPFLTHSNRPAGQTVPRSLIPLRSDSGQGDKSSVVYFMPDGRVIVRYETEGYFDTGLRSQAFVVIRVNTDGEYPKLEFVKVRYGLESVMKSMAAAFLGIEEGEILQRVMAESSEPTETSYDEDNPGTHAIDCDCFLCIPGSV